MLTEPTSISGYFARKAAAAMKAARSDSGATQRRYPTPSSLPPEFDDDSPFPLDASSGPPKAFLDAVLEMAGGYDYDGDGEFFHDDFGPNKIGLALERLEALNREGAEIEKLLLAAYEEAAAETTALPAAADLYRDNRGAIDRLEVANELRRGILHYAKVFNGEALDSTLSHVRIAYLANDRKH